MKALLFRICLTISFLNLSVLQKLYADLAFEYPYTCGTWFNRGKNTIHMIEKKLEENNITITSSVKAFHQGEYPPEYNGEFNIYMNKEGIRTVVATSGKDSPYYHEGLKFFAYTFFRVDESNGERQYLEEFPQKNELLDYVLKRTVQMLKSNKLR